MLKSSNRFPFGSFLAFARQSSLICDTPCFRLHCCFVPRDLSRFGSPPSPPIGHFEAPSATSLEPRRGDMRLFTQGQLICHPKGLTANNETAQSPIAGRITLGQSAQRML